jgi:hypothetical protein
MLLDVFTNSRSVAARRIASPIDNASMLQALQQPPVSVRQQILRNHTYTGYGTCIAWSSSSPFLRRTRFISSLCLREHPPVHFEAFTVFSNV